MTVFFEKLVNISTAKVGFYTIRFKNQPLTEYERFLAKDFSNHVLELKILKTTIKKMGIKGAKTYYFPKSEKGAFALPIVDAAIKNANKKDFGIRLYCVHLSESVVILLNGGIKTHRDPDKCPNVSDPFNTAIKLENKIQRAYHDELITLEECKINFDDNFNIDI